jgi:hypothetical protein
MDTTDGTTPPGHPATPTDPASPTSDPSHANPTSPASPTSLTNPTSPTSDTRLTNPSSPTSDASPTNPASPTSDIVRLNLAGLSGTGDTRVDEAVAQLGRLDDAPLGEHPAILGQVHDRLREVLGELSPGDTQRAAGTP